MWIYGSFKGRNTGMPTTGLLSASWLIMICFSSYGAKRGLIIWFCSSLDYYVTVTVTAAPWLLPNAWLRQVGWPCALSDINPDSSTTITYETKAYGTPVHCLLGHGSPPMLSISPRMLVTRLPSVVGINSHDHTPLTPLWPLMPLACCQPRLYPEVSRCKNHSFSLLPP